MWGKWSECSKKCGGGKRDRSRLCDSPAPAFGGKPCDGPNKDTGSCNTDQCPGKLDQMLFLNHGFINGRKYYQNLKFHVFEEYNHQLK